MQILIVQTAFLGDVVLTTPLLRELARVHPHASMTVLTTETGRQVLSGQPGIRRLLVLDKSWGRDAVRSHRKVVRALAGDRFDVAIAAQRSVRTGFLVRLSRAEATVGFAGAPGAWAYDCRVPWRGDRHAVHRYLELAVPLGGDPAVADAQPHLVVEAAADDRVRRRLRALGLAGGEDLLCVAPGSMRATKRWLPEGYAEVVRAARTRGLAPILVGSARERELCLAVAELAGVPVPVLAGEIGIPELIALVARARGLVGNDSGPAHVASAVGTAVISIFGATSPAQGYAAYGPRTTVIEHPDLACRPCSRNGPRSCPLGHFRCMREIEPARVVASLASLPGAAPRAASAPAVAGAVAPLPAAPAAQPSTGVAPG